jgi:hypothetical protein
MCKVFGLLTLIGRLLSALATFAVRWESVGVDLDWVSSMMSFSMNCAQVLPVLHKLQKEISVVTGSFCRLEIKSSSNTRQTKSSSNFEVRRELQLRQ